MKKYEVRCPTFPDLNGCEGCGEIFVAAPNPDGYFECPECGLWFDPETHPGVTLLAVTSDLIRGRTIAGLIAIAEETV